MEYRIIKYYDNYLGGYRYQLHKKWLLFWFLVWGSCEFADYGLAERWAKHYNIKIPI